MNCLSSFQVLCVVPTGSVLQQGHVLLFHQSLNAQGLNSKSVTNEMALRLGLILIQYSPVNPKKISEQNMACFSEASGSPSTIVHGLLYHITTL